ncbi:RADC family protein [Purpureocillium lavendulum]|uniref:RADC family protein n=1 Tax=Purpureocillium lavendulum TaxID=1247861 RepID=A0AB34FYW7_9HYPO|nr:RADC family protein [Purpureocillium lavendulum]
MADHVNYVGSGPYCYANALAMMLGKDSPPPAVIEFATSSPFGMQIIGGDLVFFDPYGWDPAACFDAALEAAGWASTLTVGADAQDALARLKEALRQGPVFVGPVEMGLLRHQPDMKGAIGADHYVVVLAVTDDGLVEMHDPHGHPYVTLPVADFMAAWRAEKLGYGKPFMMRTDFRQVERGLTDEDVIRRSLDNARRWLSMAGPHLDDVSMPPGSHGNGAAAEALAQMLVDGPTPLGPGLRMPLVHFAVRVGARRLADAATCLARVGRDEAAGVVARQARLVGALQHPLVVRDDARAAALLRELAPTYEALRAALGG